MEADGDFWENIDWSTQKCYGLDDAGGLSEDDDDGRPTGGKEHDAAERPLASDACAGTTDAGTTDAGQKRKRHVHCELSDAMDSSDEDLVTSTQISPVPVFAAAAAATLLVRGKAAAAAELAAVAQAEVIVVSEDEEGAWRNPAGASARGARSECRDTRSPVLVDDSYDDAVAAGVEAVATPKPPVGAGCVRSGGVNPFPLLMAAASATPASVTAATAAANPLLTQRSPFSLAKGTAPRPTRPPAAQDTARGQRRPLSAAAGTSGAGASGGARRRPGAFGPGNTAPRPFAQGCPGYKRVPGTPFVVDAFRFAGPAVSSHYVLTHAHSDHYGGLSRQFDCGAIYCSATTAALLQTLVRVSPTVLRPLPMDQPVAVAGGVTMTLLDANHCPGSAMFLFELADGRAYLHVGDFRWCRAMQRDPILQRLRNRRLEALFLDTTYANPAYAFPPQEACIEAVVQMALQHARDPGVLLLFGSYSVGKERLFMAVAKALDEPVYVDKAKLRSLACLDWSLREMSRLTSDPTAARIHVVPMNRLSLPRLRDQLGKLRGAYTDGSNARKMPAAPAAVAAAGTGPKKAKFTKGGSAAVAVPYMDALLARSRDAGAAGVTPELAAGEDAKDAFAMMLEANARLQSRKRYGPFHSIVAFRPTGWTHAESRARTGQQAHGDAAEGALDVLELLTQFRYEVSTWDRRMRGEDDSDPRAPALPHVPTAEAAPFEGSGAPSLVGDVLPRGGGTDAMIANTAPEDLREFRRSKTVTSTVVIPAEPTASPLLSIHPQPLAMSAAATDAGIETHLVKMTVQNRSCVGGGKVTLFGVPYSEHSSFLELKSCVRWLDPKRIVPTVNCRSAEDAAALERLLRS